MTFDAFPESFVMTQDGASCGYVRADVHTREVTRLRMLGDDLAEVVEATCGDVRSLALWRAIVHGAPSHVLHVEGDRDTAMPVTPREPP